MIALRNTSLIYICDIYTSAHHSDLVADMNWTLLFLLVVGFALLGENMATPIASNPDEGDGILHLVKRSPGCKKCGGGGKGGKKGKWG